MDRLKAMRQRDWARVFGFACVAVGLGLSIAGYEGAQWDALILLLGALMLLRAAVEGPSPDRMAGLMRALRVVLFMFAFAAVNRAQGGVEGAVTGVLANWVLWAVAALLFALPLARKGLVWGHWTAVRGDLVALAGAGMVFWALYGWIEGSTDMAALRVMVSLAVIANAAPFWDLKGQPVLSGLAWGLGLTVVFVTPGEAVWPVAVGVAPVAAGFALIRR